ncbi:unnamed protein product [Cyprideis torosa]|uniref:Uncharacterized protein n=1 Tax=Cyprideis torosa TaxID=163714 RepID=A0A7R8W700_9CRUS|nr:unnamed protein product [Cyprideis torosa]CAG0884598.1 unnamed protein product [Cyprideis torosa]
MSSLSDVPAEFRKLCCQAHLCKLADVAPLENEDRFSQSAAQKLMELISNRILKIDDVVELLDNDDPACSTKYSVLLCDTIGDRDISINAKLVDLKLVRSTGEGSLCVEIPVLGSGAAFSRGQRQWGGPRRPSARPSNVRQSQSPSSAPAQPPASEPPAEVVGVTTIGGAPAKVELDPAFMSNPALKYGEPRQLIQTDARQTFLPVRLLRVESPSMFTVRPMDINFFNKFSEMHAHLQKAYGGKEKAKESSLHNSIRQGTYVVVFDEREYKEWFRAEIKHMNHETETAKVYLIDIGEERQGVPFRLIHPMDDVARQTKMVTIPCCLTGIKPATGKWPQRATELLEELAERHEDVLYMYRRGAPGPDKVVPIDLLGAILKRGGPLEMDTWEYRGFSHYLYDSGLAIPDPDIPPSVIRTPLVEDDLLGRVDQTSSQGPVATSTRSPSPTHSHASSTTNVSMDLLTSNPITHESSLRERVYRGYCGWLPSVYIPDKIFCGTPTHFDVKDGTFYIIHCVAQEPWLLYIRAAIQSIMASKDEAPKQKDIQWVVGEPCIALFIDQKWYRGVVAEIKRNREAAGVLFVDYGNIEEVPFSGMRRETLFKDIPLQCMRLRLSHIAQKWESDPKKSELVGEHIKLNFIEQPVYVSVDSYSKGVYYVRLVIDSPTSEQPGNGGGPGSEERARKKRKRANRGPYDELPAPTCFKQENEGEYLPVIVSHVDEVYPAAVHLQPAISPEGAKTDFEQMLLHRQCIFEEKVRELNDNWHTLKPLPLEKWKAGSPCCAMYSVDQRWYRGKIVRVDGKSAKVLFVDYGNWEKRQLSSLLDLPEEYVALPKMSWSCVMLGVRPFPGPREVWLKAAVTAIQKRVRPDNRNSPILAKFKTTESPFGVELLEPYPGDPSGYRHVLQPLATDDILQLKLSDDRMEHYYALLEEQKAYGELQPSIAN